MVQVLGTQTNDLAYWYSSKPKYPLHVYVATALDIGCITGMEQYFYEEGLSWRYQITSMTQSSPVSSWWAEKDILNVVDDTCLMEEQEGNEVISSCYLSGLDEVNKFVQEYGEKALKNYHETGVKRELRVCFWDAFIHGV